MDIHSKEVRSFNMSRIKGKNTKPEEKVRKFLFSRGFRYRKNDKKLPGHPDIVLPKYKTVIFINGCFWHAHDDCSKFVFPKSNMAFWENKFEQNRKRDKEQYEHLKKIGYEVIIVWECELSKEKFEDTMDNIIQKLTLK